MANALKQARRLVSQEDAHMVQGARVPRSRFLGSWAHKTTFDAGKLIPFMVDEFVPGDHLRYDVTAYLRLATPVFPIMDSQRIDTHFFAVPYRIVWQNFVRMMGEQDAPTDSIDYALPYIDSPAGGFGDQSLYDYMGLPTDLDPAGTVRINALPIRAYALICHEWFRDQAVSPTSRPGIGDGPDTHSWYGVFHRMKSADYFTTALPWPQRFNAPSFAVGGQAPVKGLAINQGATPTAGTTGAYETDGTSMVTNGWPAFYTSNSANTLHIRAAGTGIGQLPAIYADLSAATAVSIESFRYAFMVQALLERDARGGTRYSELVKSHFDVRVPDFRVQRPEFIGGGSSPLSITPIAQTAAGDDPVGTLGAAGSSVGQHKASYAATEHGVIIGLISVKTELSYQQGMARMWERRTRLEMYWPELAQLGEQAILRKELYAKGIAADNTVFGYQERYHEFRSRQSMVTGKFRSSATGTLDAWHFAENFGSAPTLSETFLRDNPPMARVLSAGEEAAGQQYMADILIRRDAVRPLPMFGTPATLGRF